MTYISYKRLDFFQILLYSHEEAIGARRKYAKHSSFRRNKLKCDAIRIAERQERIPFTSRFFISKTSVPLICLLYLQCQQIQMLCYCKACLSFHTFQPLLCMFHATTKFCCMLVNNFGSSPVVAQQFDYLCDKARNIEDS